MALRLTLGLGFTAGVTVTVSISGTTAGFAQHNVELTATASKGTPSAYEWQEGGVAIAGATLSTFTPVIGTNVSDEGSLRCKVTVDGTAYFSTAYEIRYAAGSAAGALADKTYLDDSAISTLDPTTDFTTTNLTITWSATGLPTGLAINSGTGAITGTPTVLGESNAVVVTATDQYSRTIQSGFTINIGNVPDTMTAPTVTADGSTRVLVDITLPVDANNDPITQYDMRYSSNAGSTWTEELNVVPETQLAIDSLPSGTAILVQTRAVSSLGNGAWSASGTDTTDAATLTLNSITWTDGAGGVSPSIGVNYSYSGLDDIRVRGITSTSATAPTKADIDAGTGTGTLEEFTGLLSGGSLTLDNALTATSETATHVHVYLEENAGAAESAIATTTTGTIDATAPALVPASCTPADGGTGADLTSDLTAIFDSTVFAGSGNFYLRNITDLTTDSTIAIGACTIGTTDVVIPFADRLASKEYAVRWDAGVVVDGWGNDVAANTGDTLWNFTAPAGGASDLVFLNTYAQAVDISSGGTVSETTASVFPDADTFLVIITSIASNTNTVSYTLTGSAVSSAPIITGATTGGDAAHNKVNVYAFFVTTSGASNLVIENTDASVCLDRKIFVYRATGRTATAAVVAIAKAVDTAAVSAPATSVPAGSAIASVVIDRDGNATGVTWSGGFAGTDEDADAQQASAAHRVSSASVTQGVTGNFTATATLGGHDATSYAAILMVALEAA